jgi:predicted DCC family thiol-disulfide oxidoreductase YuxK
VSKIVLYTGKECHLCDIALRILQEAVPDRIQDLQKIDINSDHQLYHLYATRIPVVQRQDTQACLFWPFDHQGLMTFLGD